MLYPCRVSLVYLWLISFCSRPKFFSGLEILTGKIALVPDPYLIGGYIHSTLISGFLKCILILAGISSFDYIAGWALIYLNKEWNKSLGGELELEGMRDGRLCSEVSVSPDPNKNCSFTATDCSFTGLLNPMSLLSGAARNSMVLNIFLAMEWILIKF